MNLFTGMRIHNREPIICLHLQHLYYAPNRFNCAESHHRMAHYFIGIYVV